jgi:hypothetical protein
MVFDTRYLYPTVGGFSFGRSLRNENALGGNPVRSFVVTLYQRLQCSSDFHGILYSSSERSSERLCREIRFSDRHTLWA